MPSAKNNSPMGPNSRAIRQFKHAFFYSLAGLVVSVGLLVFMLATRSDDKGMNGVTDVVIIVIVCALLVVGCGIALTRLRR